MFLSSKIYIPAHCPEKLIKKFSELYPAVGKHGTKLLDISVVLNYDGWLKMVCFGATVYKKESIPLVDKADCLMNT